MSTALSAIFRYPVKGLAGESLQEASLQEGEGLPHDRRFAIAHGSTRFDAANPTWQPKTNFLMLMRDEKLAQLELEFDPEAGVLTLGRKGKQVVRGKVSEPLGRTLVSQFFSHFMAEATRGSPKLVEAPGHMFSDSRQKLVSILNLNSVLDLERVVRKPVAPARFRANLHLDGLAPWEEFTWLGKTISVGGVRLKVVEAIERCAATNVNPDDATRDPQHPTAAAARIRPPQHGGLCPGRKRRRDRGRQPGLARLRGTADQLKPTVPLSV